jgi:hypothetical protein
VEGRHELSSRLLVMDEAVVVDMSSTLLEKQLGLFDDRI